MRRAVALGVLVVFVVLIALGVHSCDVSATNNALRDFSDNVSALIARSDQTGQQFFTLLSSGQGSSNAPSFEAQLNNARHTAFEQLKEAEGFGVPDQMKTAQTDLLLALEMRNDGIGNIALEVEPALQAATATAAVNSIAAEMARFYASDVLYKDYALPSISGALHGAGIAVGGANGQQLNEGQFLPNLQWLTPGYVASALHATTATTTGANCTPSSAIGHSMNAVSVGGATLQTGSTNTIAASPPPTFSLTVGTGSTTERNVKLRVTLSGSSISGQAVLPSTPANQDATGQVTLDGSPPAGNYTLSATVVPVPCETDTSNNTLTFPVTFP